jgi:hypothetical protein
MTVYVGMDVHRKRSQIAIVDDAGDQLRNRNLVNDPAKLCRSLASCRQARRWRRGGLRLGLAGRPARGVGAGAAPGPSQPL